MSLLEVGLVAVLFATLAATLLGALLYSQELAEKTVVETTIRNIRSGMMLQVAQRMMAGRDRDSRVLLDQNPFDWLDRAPNGYVGRRDNPSTRDLEPGQWFYDPKKKEIGYRRKPAYWFNSGDQDILRWRVTSKRVLADGLVEGLSIESITP